MGVSSLKTHTCVHIVHVVCVLSKATSHLKAQGIIHPYMSSGVVSVEMCGKSVQRAWVTMTACKPHPEQLWEC